MSTKMSLVLIRDFLRSHKRLTALLLTACAFGFVGWKMAASIHGWWDAQLELRRGHYEILGVGLQADWAPEYDRLLHERYGIGERVVAGCIVPQSLGDYVQSYNSTIMRAANRKFGRDVFEETVADARRNWRVQHPVVGLQ